MKIPKCARCHRCAGPQRYKPCSQRLGYLVCDYCCAFGYYVKGTAQHVGVSRKSPGLPKLRQPSPYRFDFKTR